MAAAAPEATADDTRPAVAGTSAVPGDSAWMCKAELSESYPAIVVTPSASPLDPTADAADVDFRGGNVGYWSDWYNNRSGGPPMYETFVTKQLIPLIEANFNTLSDRKHRAIFGVSMGLRRRNVGRPAPGPHLMTRGSRSTTGIEHASPGAQATGRSMARHRAAERQPVD